MSEDKALPPLTDETLNLMELHRRLTELEGFTYAQEHDAYSLAQPSPFRFVPSVASNRVATLMQGE